MIIKIASPKALALPPHLYEISSMALKGILTEDVDQTIVVSGESGAGKTIGFNFSIETKQYAHWKQTTTNYLSYLFQAKLYLPKS